MRALDKETTLNIRINENTKLVLKQIVVYDQFSPIFEQIIKTYNAPSHICAYAAVANVRILKEFGIQQGLTKMMEKEKGMEMVKQKVEEMMKSIFMSRFLYASNRWQNDGQKIKQYCSEWIANYELGDYMKTLALEDVYIFRHVGLYHQSLFEKTQDQERERIIQDETPFQNEPYFIYYPKEDKYIKKDQFEFQNNHIYIFDTMGHFICGWVKLKEKNNKEITILETITNRDSKQNQKLQMFFI